MWIALGRSAVEVAYLLFFYGWWCIGSDETGRSRWNRCSGKETHTETRYGSFSFNISVKFEFRDGTLSPIQILIKSNGRHVSHDAPRAWATCGNSCKVFSMAVVLNWQPKFSLCNSRITALTVAHLQLHLQHVCCMAKTSQPHAIAPASCGPICWPVWKEVTFRHSHWPARKPAEKNKEKSIVIKMQWTQSHAGPCRQSRNMIDMQLIIPTKPSVSNYQYKQCFIIWTSIRFKYKYLIMNVMIWC